MNGNGSQIYLMLNNAADMYFHAPDLQVYILLAVSGYGAQSVKTKPVKVS